MIASLLVSAYALSTGAQPCTFYLQNGYCKFGPTCKFDHPVGSIKYSSSASSLTETPVAPYLAGPSLPTLPPPSLSTEIQSEYALGSQRDSQSNRTMSSGDASVGLTLTQTTSALLSSSRSMGGDDESLSPLLATANNMNKYRCKDASHRWKMMKREIY
ncbi:hypothetical protein Cgig2_002615 [Carnegiea gigantea]|uniref:C3H1-type domain-containing protein n=1 Tax=Carnegiea gigantea TaxID=171969 RepID=A0A9Q1Q9Y6_9CARY|nr:hypothetical protein Cgig2_002615 [Carnegiea gigantea]